MVTSVTQSESTQLRLSTSFSAVAPALFWALLVGYTAFSLATLFGSPVGQFDDAIPLLHGWLVQQGKTPNVDFYSFYPPLNTYVNAALFTLLGRSVVDARLFTSALYLIALLLALRVFKPLTASLPPVFLPAVGLLFAASMGAAISLPALPGFALSLSALFLYLDGRAHHRYVLGFTALAGVLTGIAILYRVNFGAYAAAVIACDFLLLDTDKTPGFRLKSALAFFLPLAASIAVLCLCIYGKNTVAAVAEFVLAAQRMMVRGRFITLRLTAAVACAIVLPGSWFAFRGLPQPRDSIRVLIATVSAISLLFLTLAGGAYASFVPLVVLAEILTVLYLHFFIFRLGRLELIALLFFCCLLHYFLSRADWMHWLLLPVGAALLLSFGAIRIATQQALALIITASFVLLVSSDIPSGVGYAKAGAHLLLRLASHPHLQDTSESIDDVVPGPGWVSVFPDQDERRAVRYVRSRTAPSDPIFVGVKDHSRIFYNDLLIYWLADRPIGVHTFQLETRDATEQPVQQRIIDDLRRNHVRWIVLDCAPQFGDETFMRLAYRGSTLLDVYIATHFAEEARFGGYAVLKRNDDGLPQAH